MNQSPVRGRAGNLNQISIGCGVGAGRHRERSQSRSSQRSGINAGNRDDGANRRVRIGARDAHAERDCPVESSNGANIDLVTGIHARRNSLRCRRGAYGEIGRASYAQAYIRCVNKHSISGRNGEWINTNRSSSAVICKDGDGR